MRLIATLQDEKQGLLLSNYLKSQQIDNVLESSTSQNWGDDNYRIPTYTVWIIEEKDLERSLEISKEFSENSFDPRYQQISEAPPLPPSSSLSENAQMTQDEDIQDSVHNLSSIRTAKEAEPLGALTFCLLLLCSLLFFFGEVGGPTPTLAETKAFTTQSLPLLPLFYSPLKKELIFDYPHTYEIVDDLISKIDTEKLQETSKIPSDLMPLVEKIHNTPYWTGFYDKIVAKLKAIPIIGLDAPLFEKIKQGEIWRLITPAFLHADIFHLLFNMIWLVILGKQLELRMGFSRYLLFVALAAIFTNVSQYLMSGVNFLGFSGVVCAMIMFVWARQKRAPWEGYLLQKSTLNFALIFLIFVLGLQLLSFYTEIVHDQPLAPQIANTAHMTGLLLGYILGTTNFFSSKT